jgi:hypothetical protein
MACSRPHYFSLSLLSPSICGRVTGVIGFVVVLCKFRKYKYKQENKERNCCFSEHQDAINIMHCHHS